MDTSEITKYAKNATFDTVKLNLKELEVIEKKSVDDFLLLRSVATFFIKCLITSPSICYDKLLVEEDSEDPTKYFLTVSFLQPITKPSTPIIINLDTLIAAKQINQSLIYEIYIQSNAQEIQVVAVIWKHDAPKTRFNLLPSSVIVGDSNKKRKF